MLRKDFQNCMFYFREKWEINLTISDAVPHFNHGDNSSMLQIVVIHNFSEIVS